MASKRKTEVKPDSFTWNDRRSTAVLALAEGKTRKEAAGEAQVSETTLYEWLKHPEFAAELDRLSLMVGIASRAHRLRLAQRVIREKTQDTKIDTMKDLLDWLKFAQSETDGVKLDLAKLAAAFGADDAPLAD